MQTHGRDDWPGIVVLSSHLPPAVGLNDVLFSHVEAAPNGPEFVGPDQQALQELLARFEPELHDTASDSNG